MMKKLMDDLAQRIREDDEEREAERKTDAYCAGYLAGRRGGPKPDDPDGAEGWTDGKDASQVRVVMPARPEGYYHMPLGSFK